MRSLESCILFVSLSFISLCFAFICHFVATHKQTTDNPPPLPVTVPPLKERLFGVHQRAPPPQPPSSQVLVGGNANFHHAMLSPPVAGQSTFQPPNAQPPAHHMNKMQQSPPGENYYNVPVPQHQHTHGAMMSNEGAQLPGMIPHAHFRHPADLSYSSAEMRQS